MIWVTGSGGMLGRMVVSLLRERNIPFVESDSNVDIRDKKAVDSFGSGTNIRWVVNCAAYTAVDAAEDDRDQAFSINRDGVRVLAEFCAEKRARLVHFSTDYVFNGKTGEPWNENDPVDPVNLYGQSKLEGEEAVRSVIDEHFIIRIAWLFGPWGKNFVSTMIRLFNERDAVSVVKDQVGCPTFTGDVAELVLTVIRRDSTDYGTYHFACAGQTDWCSFAREIYRQAHNMGLLARDVPIRPVTSEEYPTRAKRPAWSVMNRNKIIAKMDIKPRPWQVAVEDYLKLIKKGCL